MSKRIILGMGAGHCGLGVLAAILAEQPAVRVTLAQPPLLPWVPRVAGPGIRERIARWKTQPGEFVGDVAAFYLPYVEEAIEVEPEIRMICLKRPEEEVTAGFRTHLDRSHLTPTNHWTNELAPGWTHHPLLTQTYPQYETWDRDEGLSRYWRDYYCRADELQEQYPKNFRVIDADDLAHYDAVRDLLDFVGIPRGRQLVATGRSPKPSAETTAVESPRPALDPKRCAVLVPFTGTILPECEDGLRELERRGYPVRRVGGYAAIDQGRNQMATDAMVEGFEETLWIDADIGFRPDDVEVMRRHDLPIVCGIYPQKRSGALACHLISGTPHLTFGEGGGLVEIRYAGAGFLLVRREVYLQIQRREGLPVCNERFGQPSIPYFFPMVLPIDDGHWYLAEDYAFCERARRCGYKIFADSTIRLWHIGSFRYGWEDAGIGYPRHGTFKLTLESPSS